jgi:5'-phosphate synthase pdxT subunit
VTTTVGVLALQGDYAAHEAAVSKLGFASRRVKTAEGLDGLDALVLPGGESTTMLKFLQGESSDGRMFEPLAEFCRSGRPVFGTCAGAILLATDVSAPQQDSLGILDIDIERNAYGRQQESFISTLEDAPEMLRGSEAVFIRAPVIRRTGGDVTTVARWHDDPVLVRSGPVWAATFHPEMTADSRVLELVLGDLLR